MLAALAGIALAAHAALGKLTPEEKASRERAREELARRRFNAEVANQNKRMLSPAKAIERIEARHGKGTAPRTLPRHIRPYANYLVSREGVDPSVRDVIKAYVLTSSSIQREGRAKRLVCYGYPEYRELTKLRKAREVASVEERIARGCQNTKNKGRIVFNGKMKGSDKFTWECADPQVRPEDVMAVLLFSEHGKKYLDAAERGVFDEQAARELVKRTNCFGLQENLFQALRYGPNIGQRRDEVVRALRSSPEEWIHYVTDRRANNVKGVKFAKVGFIASLLGRGDIPTLDAREINLWIRDPAEGEDATSAKLAVFRKRIAQYPMMLAPEHEKHRGHLVHHALWDAFPGADERPTQTTHGAVIRAMQFAGTRGK